LAEDSVKGASGVAEFIPDSQRPAVITIGVQLPASG